MSWVINLIENNKVNKHFTLRIWFDKTYQLYLYWRRFSEKSKPYAAPQWGCVIKYVAEILDFSVCD